MLNKLSHFSGQSRFKDASLVTLGTIIGQAAVILATPLITRLFGPEVMGLYAVYASIVGLLVVILAGHYELAIPLPKFEKEALTTLKLAFLIATIFTILISLITIVGKKSIISILDADGLSQYFWLIPIACLLSSAAVILSFWSIRKKTFHLTAMAKAGQGFGQICPQIILGYLNFGVIGMIAGHLLGQIVSITALAASLPKRTVKSSKLQVARLYVVAKKYRKLPLISVWSSLINSLSAHLPVLVIAAAFGPFVTGLYALSFRVLQLPVRIIGSSISQVFFSIASDAKRDQTIANITKNLFIGLISFSLPSLLALALIAPPLFEWVFGTEWRDAGVYTQVLMPWIFFTFISTTLSILVTVMSAQGKEFIFQLMLLVATVIGLLNANDSNGPLSTLMLLSTLCSVVLLVKVIWLLNIVGIKVKKVIKVFFNESLSSLLLICAYTVAANIFTEIIVAILILIILLIIHLFNLRVRKIYGV